MAAAARFPIPLQKSGVVVAKTSPIEEEFAAVDDDEDAVEAVEEVEGDEKTEEGDTARFRSLGGITYDLYLDLSNFWIF